MGRCSIQCLEDNHSQKNDGSSFEQVDVVNPKARGRAGGLNAHPLEVPVAMLEVTLLRVKSGNPIIFTLGSLSFQVQQLAPWTHGYHICSVYKKL